MTFLTFYWRNRLVIEVWGDWQNTEFIFIPDQLYTGTLKN